MKIEIYAIWLSIGILTIGLSSIFFVISNTKVTKEIQNNCSGSQGVILKSDQKMNEKGKVYVEDIYK